MRPHRVGACPPIRKAVYAMKNKSKLVGATLVLMLALSAGALTGCLSEEEGGSSANETVVSAGQEAAGDQTAAEALIGQSLTREEIEEAVGAGERFEMNNAGCERGVYGGYFYYSNFSIFSKTYDKGGSFTIVSVS